MKITTATITDVENALLAFKAAAEQDTKLEGLSAKKLAAAVDALTPKDGVAKDLNQAYTHAEKKWATNVLDEEKDGCTRDNKIEKIKQYVTESTSYIRLIKDSTTKDKAERWIAEKFPIPAPTD